VADAGADQTVRRGATVSLDGSASTLAGEYSWKQISGPAVTIAGATTAKPTFALPLMSLPTSTTSNPGYTVAAPEPIVIELTITAPGGTTATDTVTVTPQLETLAITNAEDRSDKREWRVSGTSSIAGAQRVAVALGTLTGRLLGTANVDATGAWSYRGTVSSAPATSITTVSAVSALGDDHSGFTFRRRN
jgi:hypothetical protein